MKGRQPLPAPPEPAANGPRRIGPPQVWETLTPSQHQQVLRRLVVMCQDCLLRPPACRQLSQEPYEEEVSHDDEHVHDAGRG